MSIAKELRALLVAQSEAMQKDEFALIVEQAREDARKGFGSTTRANISSGTIARLRAEGLYVKYVECDDDCLVRSYFKISW